MITSNFERITPNYKGRVDAFVELRQALVRQRKARRISLRMLAEAIGCSRSALSEYENGASNTSIMTVFLYAQHVGVQIFFETDDFGDLA